MPGKRSKVERSAGMDAALSHERTTRTPAKAAAVQARNKAAPRKASVGADPAAYLIGPFEEAFCFHMARLNLPSRAHHVAEVQTNIGLDLSAYTVILTEIKTKKGTVCGTRKKIFTKDGSSVTEEEVRYGKAAHLLYYPEIRARIAQIKADRAEAISVSAAQIAEELDSIMELAMETGQLATAMQTRAAKAKMFGIEANTNDTTVTHRGGVMVVPGVCDVKTWGAAASASQANLKDEVKR